MISLFDKDELVVTHSLLHHLLGLTQHAHLERLLALQVGQR